MNRQGLILFLSLLCAFSYGADTLTLTLDECRTMALFDNTQAKIDEEALAAADYARKAALAGMFPRFSANAAYLYNTGEIHLVPNTIDLGFGSVTAYDELGHGRFTINKTGTMTELLNALRDVPGLGSEVGNIETRLGQVIADGYQELYDRFSPNLTHVFVGQVGVMQPVYVGGRLREMYRIAQASERMAEINQQRHSDELVRKVDEAYWRVVLVQRKKQLATDYLALLTQLESDVTIAAQAGLATGSDMLNVRVKKTDAQQKLLEATNGLELSLMALSEICGKPLETIILPSTDVMQTQHTSTTGSAKTDNDLLMMEELEKIAVSQRKITAAALQPNLLATASYVYAAPSFHDGMPTEWRGKGSFNVGVVLNLPIAHADAVMRYKAAKHTARIAQLKREEAQQLVAIRERQRQQRLDEAQQKMMMQQTAVDNAKENLRYAEELYQAGMITASELMQQQTAWLAAETDLIEAAVSLRKAEKNADK
ncbi:MAG: TolC family protein [Paludibacteraceae bacterium]|nr:TolC family protein [Paludibacteraceae bacterium]